MSDTLAAALAAFQAEAPRVAKDKTARVPTKAGGQYSYQYADLADIAAAAYPLLAKHGLSFACLPEIGERGMALRGVLLHTSGERLEGVLPLHGGGTPQEVGSALTYARRYLLGAMTGIVTDTDDDGALAQAAASRPAPRQQAPRPAPQPAENAPQASGTDLATEPQLKALWAAAKSHGYDDPGAFKDFLTDQCGRLIESTKQLTKREASRILDHLKGEK